MTIKADRNASNAVCQYVSPEFAVCRQFSVVLDGPSFESRAKAKEREDRRHRGGDDGGYLLRRNGRRPVFDDDVYGLV